MSRIPPCFPSLLLLFALYPPVSAQADAVGASDEPILVAPGYSDEEKRLLSSESLPTGLTLPEISDDSASNPPDASAETANDLWQRIRNGFGIASLQSPFTATHESWYAARPQYMQRMVDRSQRYLYHVVEEVQKRGMPTEIALLPMVESAFNPTANSTAKAAGIWQFIPSTGKNFGLKQDWWTDNRRDVTAATNAALNYLEKLHVMFGTWELALAAYNAGEGTVQRAIERNRRQGLPTDYQSLQLPAETKNYVPKLQAIKNIVTNPQQYGLNIKSIDNKPYFSQVTAPGKIDVKLAAKLAGVSEEEFTQLNPAHNRPVMATSAGSQNILLPAGKEETFAENLANYNRPLVSWQTHYAKRGERIGNIAKQYGISVAQLRDANALSSKQLRLNPNQPLLVPATGGAAEHAAANLPENIVEKKPEPADTKPTIIHHTVKKGDSLDSIAKHYGLTGKLLLAQNHLKNGKLHQGQVLVIHNEKNIEKNSAPSNGKNRVAKPKTTKPQATKIKATSAKGKPRAVKKAPSKAKRGAA